MASSSFDLGVDWDASDSLSVLLVISVGLKENSDWLDPGLEGRPLPNEMLGRLRTSASAVA